MGEQKARKELWMVEDRGEGNDAKSFWTRVGVAFENRDGSWSLIFAAYPVNGRVQMRDPSPREDGDDARRAPEARDTRRDQRR